MTPQRTPPEPVPSDYDDNPDRMRLARSVLRRHAAAGDVHELVARRFVAEALARVLNVGCGEGELARYLPAGTWVGLDNSQTMLDRAPAGGVLGEATALPFPNGSFDSVAILYVLYHLSDPRPRRGPPRDAPRRPDRGRCPKPPRLPGARPRPAEDAAHLRRGARAGPAARA